MPRPYTLASSSIPPKTLLSEAGTLLQIHPCPEFQMVHTVFYLLLENGILGTSLRLHKISLANYLTLG